MIPFFFFILILHQVEVKKTLPKNTNEYEWKYINTNQSNIQKQAGFDGIFGEYFSSMFYPRSRQQSGSYRLNVSMYVFGGRGIAGYYGDLWEYHMKKNMWRFVNTRGNDIQKGVGFRGICTNEDVFSNMYYPGSRYSVGTFTYGKSLYTFGGYGRVCNHDTRVGDLGDLWELDVETKKYKFIQKNSIQKGRNFPSGLNYPSARRGTGFFTFNSSLFIFGGRLSINNLGDLWEYTIENSQWKYINTNNSLVQQGVNFDSSYGEVFDSKYFPGSRHFSTFFVHKNSAYLFGGYKYNPALTLGDLWELNITSKLWRWRNTIGNDTQTKFNFDGSYGNVLNSQNYPCSRYHTSSFVYLDSGYIFGGQSNIGRYGDLWEYRINKNQWRYISTTFDEIIQQKTNFKGVYGEQFNKSYYPSARYASSFAINNQSFYIFSGYGESETTVGYLGDLHQLFLPYICFGLKSDNDEVCNSHGICVGNEKCKCKNIIYNTEDCRRNDSVLFTMIFIFPVIVVLLICIVYLGICIKFVVDTVKRNKREIQEQIMETMDNLTNAEDFIKSSNEAMETVKFKSSRDAEDVFVNFNILWSKNKGCIGQTKRGFKMYISSFEDYPVLFKVFETSKHELSKSEKEIPMLEFSEEKRDPILNIKDNIVKLADIQHRGIVYLFAASIDEKKHQVKIGLAEQLCKNHNVRAFLHKYQKERGMFYPFNKKLEWIETLCDALKYIHISGYVYGEVVTSNIMVDNKYQCKLRNEFMLPKFFRKGNVTSKERYYVSPQVFTHKPEDRNYTDKSDVFGFAFCMYEILTEIFDPFKSKTNGKAMKRIANDPNYRPKLDIKIDIPHYLKVIIESCWSHKEENRMSLEEVATTLKEESSKDSIVIYIKTEGEDEIDASDYSLKKRTIKGIKELVVEIYNLNKSSKKYSLWVKDKKGNYSIHIKSNSDVSKYVKTDAIILVKGLQPPLRPKTKPRKKDKYYSQK